MELLIGLLLLVALDVVALGYGFDSRDGDREALARAEHDAGAAAWRA